jgi:hypothetical protein
MAERLDQSGPSTKRSGAMPSRAPPVDERQARILPNDATGSSEFTYREPRCAACGHSIGAHFTNPARCMTGNGCACTEYVPSDRRDIGRADRSIATNAKSEPGL